ncbi:MAG: glycosyltransferase family 2 protein [Microcoleaceae cyanobacterium MO_207.B10]|nr:glycosyltransferase family 2 protein [Microcoleaceae cyanobacterium MO_207.B10]
MKVLIPLAARSQFFPPEEYHFPVPLIEVNGIPIIQLVVDNLSAIAPDIEFIFVALAEECRAFSLDNVLGLVTNNKCTVVELQKPTMGALCSSLMAIDYYNDDEPLIIANTDQFFDLDLSQVVTDFQSRNLDAAVISFETVHPRWAYISVDENHNIIEATVKKVVSHLGIAGFYYFARGQDFVWAAMAAISHGSEVNGSYYVASALNELILKGMKLGHHQVSKQHFHSFYLPKKINDYERLLQSQALNFMPKRNFSVVSANGETKKTYSEVTIVIPMAGIGSRFVKQGYQKPKPFIDVLGKTMIEQVMENLSLPGARYILLGRQEHLETESQIVARLQRRDNVKFLPVEKLTEGTACTVLLARQDINLEAPLLIANCDQLVDFWCADFINDCVARELDGSILVFRDSERNPKWSFARTNAQGFVQKVKEKVAISDLATVGIYLFSKGKDFVTSAIDMIVHNDRVNGEFYTCPVYNYAISNGKKIGVFEIAPEAMHGLGTPEDLETYLQLRNCA